MTSTTSSPQVHASKGPSWIPLVAAFLLPALAVALAAFLYARRTPEQNPPPSMNAGLVPQAYITVLVQNRAGSPVAGHEVSFIQKRTGGAASTDLGAEIEFKSSTDSAGIATMSMPKVGRLTIHVEGAKRDEAIPSLEAHAKDQVSFTMELDE